MLRGERMTIIEAIKEAMHRHGAPMRAVEAYNAIIRENLYEFHARDPAHVVLMQIRRHCEGIDFPSAGSTKHFKLVEENKFLPLDKPTKRPHGSGRSHAKRREKPSRRSTLESTLRNLEAMHAEYLILLRERLIAELRRISPSAFEVFSKELLRKYGFEDIHVTQVSRDGGIDGYGRLRVGLAHLNVAFQCKRWTKGSIHRPEVDRFRGATQGDFEQGIFFATTSFSQGAIDASIKKGAVPIVLIDSNAIVSLMIEKQFGVTAADMKIPTYALDLALTPEAEQVSS
jgi:restriction system protein